MSHVTLVGIGSPPPSRIYFNSSLFHSTFPEKEIEKEKDVVIEEINSYRDTPADLIFDDFEEFAFEGHPLAHNILGQPRNVRHFTSERLREFMRQRYTPDRMVIAIVGGIDPKRAIRLCFATLTQLQL